MATYCHCHCLCPGAPDSPFPGPHLCIVDVVGATVLSKLAEGLEPGGIGEVGANSACEGAGVEEVNTQGALPPGGALGALGLEREVRVQPKRPVMPSLSPVSTKLPCSVGPHHPAPSRDSHTGPAGRGWGSGSHGLHGGGRPSLPSRWGSVVRRSAHTRWPREGCREWRPKLNPGLGQLTKARAALRGGEQTDGWMEGPSSQTGPGPGRPQTGQRGLVQTRHAGVRPVGRPGAETQAGLEEVREVRSEARDQAPRGLPEKRF